ncbi:MAG: ATP-binding protein [Phormidesmis sp.]
MTHHILVVDDEPDIEALITQKFRHKIRNGEYLFTFASNGAQAFQQVVETSAVEMPAVDMVLTDINMPVMDGLALIERLSTLEQPPKTVVVSAYNDMANIRAAMNSGAFDFVTKPINFQDLVTTLEKTLKVVAQEKAHLAQLEQTKIQLVQSEKMSSLGQMMAGVAHEINNPINFIYGNLKPARNYVQDLVTLIDCYQACYPNPKTEVKDCLEDIDLDFLRTDLDKLLDSLSNGTVRIRELVLSLRNFSRLDEAERKCVDIHEGIESTLVILSSRLKSSPARPEIPVIRQYGQVPPVSCYPSQMNQVIMNIVGNAIDAFEEDSDRDSLQVSKAEPDAIWIETEIVDGDWVRIAIADNGPGMSAKTQAKLFDPFFTTKDIGKGTGLGLSISYQIIVDKHGGRLSCESVMGEGTKFTIEFPYVCS